MGVAPSTQGALQPGPRAPQPRCPWSPGLLQAASLIPGTSPTFSCCKTLKPSLNGLAGGDLLQGAELYQLRFSEMESQFRHLEVGRMTRQVRPPGAVFMESCSQAPGQAGTWGGGSQSCPRGTVPPCRLGAPSGTEMPSTPQGATCFPPSLRVRLPRRPHARLL